MTYTISFKHQKLLKYVNQQIQEHRRQLRDFYEMRRKITGKKPRKKAAKSPG